MPQPEQLDDSEFQVYSSLKAWRFRYRNELEVEPYNKIIQDRTLCELIRKRRNDAGFASRQMGKSDTIVMQDLLSVWGVGPSKAAKDGVAWEILNVLDSEENHDLLELSRQKEEMHDGGRAQKARKQSFVTRKQSRANLPSTRNIPEPNPKLPRYVVFKKKTKG
ncbi:hypothetical protein ACHAXR_007305 [Thalassiosira sp. AJA248-18]